MRIITALAIALSMLYATHSQGELNMCTGAEPAAAEAAKGAAEVAGAAEGAGATAGSLATANAVGAAGGDALGSLIASNAGTWGVTVAPEVAATGLSAAATGARSILTPANIAAGGSAVNAGAGIVQAMTAKRGAPAAPQLAAPKVMPTTDDEAARRARAALIQQFSARRGRSSTILSNDTLGGQ